MNRKSIFALLVLFSVMALAACSTATATPASAPSVTADDASIAQPADTTSVAKLNLNTATADEFLAAMPDLGNRMVREFMEYRPYLSIQQFRQEIGKYVDAAQVTEYEQYVYVPIQINDSDAATLQQIPGLSADEAEALIAARPFESTDAFLTKLGDYISADELATAQTYLGDN